MRENIQQVVDELRRLSEALETASNEYSDAVRLAAHQRTDYDLSWAKAIMTAPKGTVADREAHATEVCEPVMRLARVAEAMRDAYKERIKALAAQLNAVQTIAAFEREDMKLSGTNYTQRMENQHDF